MKNDEFAGRRARLAAQLSGHKADALLVTFLANVRYLTGFTGSNGLLLLDRDGKAIFFTDPRYAVQSAKEVDCRIRVSKGAMLAAMVAVVTRRRIRRLGFEKSRLSFEQHDFLRDKLPMRATLVPVGGLVESQRMVKSAGELALIRQAVATNSRAFEQTVGHIRPGSTRESDLAAELDYRMRKLGASGPSFETIVAVGARSALPHARPGGQVLEKNEVILIDMGATQAGYASDMTRMLFPGSPGGRLKRLYRAVLEAQLAAIAAVRSGVSAAQIDRAARQVLQAENLDKAFLHSTGHGLGLEIHEPPRLGKKEKIRLQEGMAITIEPGVYLEDFCGVRIEDTVVVTRTGCEVLTPTSKELLEI